MNKLLPKFPLKVSFTDLETGGLDEHEHPIIELGLVQIEHYDKERPWLIRPYNEWYSKVAPEMPVGEEAARINGYTPEKWEGAPAVTDVLLKYFDMVQWTNFGGQNPAFDKKFIDATARRHGIQWPKMSGYRLVGTEMLSWKLLLEGKIENVKQETLAAFLGLGKQTHDALGDIRQCVKIYEKLLQYQFGLIQL